MKFAIRDDDLNYFYTSEFIEKNLNEIKQICPISMAAIPLVKGNWPSNTKLIENVGPFGVTNEMIKLIQKDNAVYDISKNKELVQYLCEEIEKGTISIAIHGIHHRNEDTKLPQMRNNFSIGAEFETKYYLTEPLQQAIQILENSFHEKIKVFTPPQNSYSLQGAISIFKNELSLCAYLPGVRNWNKFIQLFGVQNYFNYVKHRLICKKIGFYFPYPFLMRSKFGTIMDHCALQPSTDVEQLIKKFKCVRDAGGNFVLSTHSYAFDYKMNTSNKNLKNSLFKILEEVSKNSEVDFVSLNELFE
jgi:hypothetical protein